MFATTELLSLQEKVSQIVKDSSKIILEKWQDKTPFTIKSDKTPVTEIDTRVEDYLRRELTPLIPGCGFILEEGEDDEKSDYNWVIDPLDQTKNLIGSLPLFYIQVALTHYKKPILGVIFNPVSGQLFSGSEGNGAYVNDVKVSIPEKSGSINNYVDVDFGSGDDDHQWKLNILNSLTTSGVKIRLTGASFAIYILTNAIQGYLVLNQKTKVVDQMPRIILMKEFGLIVEEIEINNKKVIVAGNPELFDKIVKEIQNELGLK
ncbi:MAG: inositol monophosphatase [Candidatus Levybacteria bacterium]|nr:inositol monophosphatase [Candidatus Levybacteria bacterium]